MFQLPPYDITDDDQIPGYNFTIQLEGSTYRFEQIYRERQDRWYMSIFDADDEPLLQAKKLSVNTRLLRRHQIAGLPPGDIMLYDTSGAEAECGYYDLGQRCELLYITAAEVAELEAAASSAASLTIVAVP